MVNRKIWVIVLLSLLTIQAQAALFTATVDRRTMTREETLILNLTLTQSDTRLRAEGEQPNIDLTPLSRDFEIGTPRERHRFNIYRNRGRATSTLHVELFPKRTGSLLIPAFRVAGLTTPAIPIRVIKSDPEQTGALFVRTGVIKTRLWVHETTLLYLDLYHRMTIKSASLGGVPDIEPNAVDITQLKSQTRNETLASIHYQVSRTAWALAPQKPGPVQIHMPDVWVETQAGQRRRLPFTDITIQAKALPADTPAGILVGRPHLQWTGFDTPAPIDMPLSGELILNANTLPALLPNQAPILTLPENLKVYHERARISGPNAPDLTDVNTRHQIQSTVRFPMHIMPKSPGSYTLPDITLPYFDIERGRKAIMTLAGPSLKVTANPLIATTTPDVQLPAEPTVQKTWFIWQAISGFFMLLWFGTATAWWRHRRQTSRKTATHPTAALPQDSTSPKARLLRAMGTRTLESGLKHWEQGFGNDASRRAIILAVQRSHYAPEADQTPTAALNLAVDRLLAELPERQEAYRDQTQGSDTE